MREGTSGLLFTQNKDGSIRLEVIDYGVEEFGGRDWESWYDLSKKTQKFCLKNYKNYTPATLKKCL